MSTDTARSASELDELKKNWTSSYRTIWCVSASRYWAPKSRLLLATGCSAIFNIAAIKKIRPPIITAILPVAMYSHRRGHSQVMGVIQSITSLI